MCSLAELIYEVLLLCNFIVQASICVKKNDKFVSQSIVETGAWEADNVQSLMKAMSFYSDTVFIGKILLLSL